MSESAPATPRPLQMGAKGAYIVRLLMVGDSACGKTSLVLRFDQNVFSTKFVTTIGVDYRDKMVKVRSCNCEWVGGVYRYAVLITWMRGEIHSRFRIGAAALPCSALFSFFLFERIFL